MKIKIISDGTPEGTHVIDVETGEKLDGVVAVEWCVKPADDHPYHEVYCWLEVQNVPIEVVADQIKTYQMRTCHAD